jgi:3-isopropylmalate/(R)-2-methylmalate dehydratase large subunit
MAPPHRISSHRRPRPGARPPRTLVEKIWAAHLPSPKSDPAVVAVDRILLHERQVGIVARRRGGGELRASQRVVACADQQVPTVPRTGPPTGAQQAVALDRLERSTDALGVAVFGPGDPRRGIVNVVAAEQGMVRPGDLVVGADAHVATLGAFGALALRISDGEVAHVVETGRLHRARPTTVRVSIAGRAGATSGKDLALWLLARLGPSCAEGSAVELAGPVVSALGVEGRMTLCNLVCETGAEAVVIAPDRLTADYLAGRPFVPSGAAWQQEVDRWTSLGSDPGSDLEGHLVVVADRVGAWSTWGTAAWQAAPLDGVVPPPDRSDPERARMDERALHLQGLVPGTRLSDIAVDQVFIGSCANARIEDLRAAAEVARGGRARVRSWVVPGSWVVKRQAEAEGLHRVFIDAGFEWREPGCSLCIGANGDAVPPDTRVASTANRPEHGRVGPRSRLHVLAPASAAATALSGRLQAPPPAPAA